MRKNSASQSGGFTLRVVVACALFSVGAFLAALSFGAIPSGGDTRGAGVRSASAVAAQGGNWSIVDSPNLTEQYLTAVTCISASDCWTVGYYKNDKLVFQTLIEHWNGSSWTIVPSPNVSATETNSLLGVTCTSASDCWAVGRGRTIPARGPYYSLIEHWDGTSWSIVTSPSGGKQLRAVTCTALSDCWAAGDNLEHWNGNSWSIVTSPSGPLYGVTCEAATDCWAVGHSSGSYFQTLIEHWNGTAWSVVSSPNTSATESNQLYAVTCSSTSQCWAVGGSGHALLERWDGVSWSIVPNNNPADESELFGVDCASASDCWAVGDEYHNGNGWTNLAQHWNGTSWSVVTSPSPNPSQDTFFNDVTCISASQCWTVGGLDANRTLIERWNGTSWSAVPSPNAVGHGMKNFLSDVKCLSPSNCWAVGFYTNFTTFDQTLIEHWDGNSWTIVTSPDGGTDHYADNKLYGLTCTSTSDCWAVGSYRNGQFPGNFDRTLIQHWNGISWSIVSSPNAVSTDDNFLLGVTCTSSADCWAVGGYLQADGYYQSIIEHWDGDSWSIIDSPNTSSTQDNDLRSVWCTSASQCWAVGGFIQLWDGNFWFIVPSPSVSRLFAVTCTSASNCWAVGNTYSNNHSLPVLEHWDGNSWSALPLPDPNTTPDEFLTGVTCASASDCWAVGKYLVYTDPGSGTNYYQTLAEHCDGNSWSLVTPPNVNTSDVQPNELRGVTCSAASRCWAVGDYQTDRGINQTLIESFTVPIPLISATRNSSDIAITFQATQGATYRLERKLNMTDSAWQSISGVSDFTATNSGPAQITDPGAASLGKAFYRVRQM